MSGALATHYAHALADAVFGEKSTIQPGEAVDQLRSAIALIGESKDLQQVLLSPAVKKTRKEAILSRLADEMGLNRTIRNFLLVVVSHRRIGEFKAMQEEFAKVVDERLGWIPADIASARELRQEEKEEIERALGTKLGKFIRAHYQVDPNLLAGVRARVASKEFDATLRGKLEGMRHRLAATH